MAKRKNKKKIVKKKDDLEQKIRSIVQGTFSPLEQRITMLSNKLENVKGNIVAVLSLLERKKIIGREEFFSEYSSYIENEVGIVDGEGKMEGRPVFSLYNLSRR